MSKLLRIMENTAQIRSITRFVVEEDGRPQGATHRRAFPPSLRCPDTIGGVIVGTGAVWTGGWAPCGRPSSSGDSHYFPGITPNCMVSGVL
jgi:hypothetical protein